MPEPSSLLDRARELFALKFILEMRWRRLIREERRSAGHGRCMAAHAVPTTLLEIKVCAWKGKL